MISLKTPINNENFFKLPACETLLLPGQFIYAKLDSEKTLSDPQPFLLIQDKRKYLFHLAAVHSS
jgi:hypothetical protein